MWLLVFLITGLVFELFLASVVQGRILPGWFYAQTLFLDSVMRRRSVLEALSQEPIVISKQLSKCLWLVALAVMLALILARGAAFLFMRKLARLSLSSG
jgi:hypothetical protein